MSNLKFRRDVIPAESSDEEAPAFTMHRRNKRKRSKPHIQLEEVLRKAQRILIIDIMEQGPNGTYPVQRFEDARFYRGRLKLIALVNLLNNVEEPLRTQIFQEELMVDVSGKNKNRLSLSLHSVQKLEPKPLPSARRDRSAYNQQQLYVAAESRRPNAIQSQVSNSVQLPDAAQSQRSDTDQSQQSDEDQSQWSDAAQSQRSNAGGSRRSDAAQSPRSDAVQGQLSDTHQSELFDSDQSQMSDSDQTQLSDADQRQLSVVAQTQRSDEAQSQLSDATQSQLSDTKESELVDAEQSELSDLEQSQMCGSNQSPLSDTYQSEMSDAKKSELFDAMQSELVDAEQSVLSNLDQIQMSDIAQSQLSDAEQSEMSDTEKSELFHAIQSELSDGEQSVLSVLDQSQMSDVGQSQCSHVSQNQQANAAQSQLPYAAQSQPPDVDQCQLSSVDLMQRSNAVHSQLSDSDQSCPSDSDSSPVQHSSPPENVVEAQAESPVNNSSVVTSSENVKIKQEMQYDEGRPLKDGDSKVSEAADLREKIISPNSCVTSCMSLLSKCRPATTEEMPAGDIESSDDGSWWQSHLSETLSPVSRPVSHSPEYEDITPVPSDGERCQSQLSDGCYESSDQESVSDVFAPRQRTAASIPRLQPEKMPDTSSPGAESPPASYSDVEVEIQVDIIAKFTTGYTAIQSSDGSAIEDGDESEQSADIEIPALPIKNPVDVVEGMITYKHSVMNRQLPLSSSSCSSSRNVSEGMRKAPTTSGRKKMAKCKHCLQMLVDEEAVQTHISRVHRKDKRFGCSFPCEYSAFTHTEVIYHIRDVHTHDHPHRCCFCQKGFNKPSDYRRHMAKYAEGGCPPQALPADAGLSPDSHTDNLHNDKISTNTRGSYVSAADKQPKMSVFKSKAGKGYSLAKRITSVQRNNLLPKVYVTSKTCLNLSQNLRQPKLLKRHFKGNADVKTDVIKKRAFAKRTGGGPQIISGGPQIISGGPQRTSGVPQKKVGVPQSTTSTKRRQERKLHLTNKRAKHSAAAATTSGRLIRSTTAPSGGGNRSITATSGERNRSTTAKSGGSNRSATAASSVVTVKFDVVAGERSEKDILADCGLPDGFISTGSKNNSQNDQYLTTRRVVSLSFEPTNSEVSSQRKVEKEMTDNSTPVSFKEALDIQSAASVGVPHLLMSQVPLNKKPSCKSSPIVDQYMLAPAPVETMTLCGAEVLPRVKVKKGPPAHKRASKRRKERGKGGNPYPKAQYFSCLLCSGKSFLRKKLVQQHVMLQHGVKVNCLEYIRPTSCYARRSRPMILPNGASNGATSSTANAETCTITSSTANLSGNLNTAVPVTPKKREDSCGGKRTKTDDVPAKRPRHTQPRTVGPERTDSSMEEKMLHSQSTINRLRDPRHSSNKNQRRFASSIARSPGRAQSSQSAKPLASSEGVTAGTKEPGVVRQRATGKPSPALETRNTSTDGAALKTRKAFTSEANQNSAMTQQEKGQIGITDYGERQRGAVPHGQEVAGSVTSIRPPLNNLPENSKLRRSEHPYQYPTSTNLSGDGSYRGPKKRSRPADSPAADGRTAADRRTAADTVDRDLDHIDEKKEVECYNCGMRFHFMWQMWDHKKRVHPTLQQRPDRIRSHYWLNTEGRERYRNPINLRYGRTRRVYKENRYKDG